MPLLSPGVYIDTGERPYEAEATYYLNFQIVSALACIKHLKNAPMEVHLPFGNKIEYFHFYTDHLLFSIGLINNRFKNNKLKERTEANRKNFRYTEETFPILSNKNFRNTIEHIDEYDQKIINTSHGVGGFNAIYEGVDEKLIRELRSRRDTHPYTLDMIEMKLYIERNQESLTLSLVDLEKELIQPGKNVKDFRDYLR